MRKRRDPLFCFHYIIIMEKWYLNTEDSCCNIQEVPLKIAYNIKTDIDDFHVAAVWKDCPNADKNAKLIATAPEMLEVIEDLLQQLEERTHDVDPHYIEKANQVIKRALS